MEYLALDEVQPLTNTDRQSPVQLCEIPWCCVANVFTLGSETHKFRLRESQIPPWSDCATCSLKIHSVT